MNNGTTNHHEPLPGGTPVLNTTDGEPGHVLAATAYDRASGRWTEYEVETERGVETWKATDLIRAPAHGDAE